VSTSPYAIVIGAGVGGLSAATHLARRGFRVTVVEKNNQAGGRCSQFTRDGHRFDAGPTLLVLPRLYEQEFAALGEDLHHCLDLQRVDPSYRLVFEDGQTLRLTSDPGVMRSQVEAIEGGSSRGLAAYLEEGRRHYELAMSGLVRRPCSAASEFFRPNLVRLVVHLHLLVRHYPHMRRFFRDPRLKAAFTFQDLYMGLSPFSAAATFSLMPYSELVHGVWYPRGGMYSVVTALQDIALRAGVEFAFGVPVERIQTDGRRVTGVQLGGGPALTSDVIIATADLPYVYRDLLSPDGQDRRLSSLDYSCSALSFYWGMDRVLPQLGPHTLFLADDYRGLFDSILDRRSLPDHPSVYVHAPARLDPAMAPPGHDTLIAIVPVGHLEENAGQDWPQLTRRARQAALDWLRVLGLGDAESHIKFEIQNGPHHWRDRLNLVHGSTHGLSHRLDQMAYLRPHNRHRRWRNLYFAGASTHPGTGVPTVLVSGRLAAERAAADFAQQRRSHQSSVLSHQTDD
jgi:phytoene desaturase